MRLSRMPCGQSRLAAEYSSHYEIIDSDLHSYILSMDAKAWRRYLCDIKVCPFCGSEATPTGSCCRRFSAFRQVTTAVAGEKLCGRKDTKSEGGKSNGKKLSVVEETKRRTKSQLASKSVSHIMSSVT